MGSRRPEVCAVRAAECAECTREGLLKPYGRCATGWWSVSASKLRIIELKFETRDVQNTGSTETETLRHFSPPEIVFHGGRPEALET